MRSAFRLDLFSFRFISVIIFVCAAATCNGQSISRQSIFAHNDYLKPRPFYDAYDARVGFIEVDVFLSDNTLVVAHTRAEINAERDIETMYLKPLNEQIRSNSGSAYRDNAFKLHLMVDVKTEALPTLKKLIEILSGYPDLTSCSSLIITISGNMPAPVDWSWIPAYINFDGRIGVHYDEDQLKRVPVISASFRNYSSWKGKGTMKDTDRARIVEVVMAVHLLHKPLRFWATPDIPKAWNELALLGVEIINTDNLAAAITYADK